MEAKQLTRLPPPDLLEKLLLRDFSQFDPVEGDDEETIEAKAQDLQKALDFFDFYYDKMVPVVAGKKVWHPYARHHECMSISKLPNKQLRVPPNTEALVAVMYRNCYKKWELMKAWDVNTQGVYPMFKKPDINPEWATEYTDACGGQQKYGGWSTAGRVKFVKLAKIVLASRKKNMRRHLQVEQDCLTRLQAKYVNLYINKKVPTKKRKAESLTPEDEELLQSLIVDEDDDDEELVENEREDVQKDTEEDVQEGDQNADEKGDDGGDSE